MHWIGTAGWSLPVEEGAQGTRLHRYSRRFSCVEVNSSFYRPHRLATWAKWSQETPPGFRFSIKAPKAITHEAKLRDTAKLLEAFFEQIQPVGEKTGPILFQLPPSLAFDIAFAEEFFSSARNFYKGDVALEPRHASWLTPAADELLQKLAIARVAADPAKGGAVASEPGGDTQLEYYRLHGSPQTYYSNYEEDFLLALAARIQARKNVWVVFDNTTLGYAYSNALRLQELVTNPADKFARLQS